MNIAQLIAASLDAQPRQYKDIADASGGRISPSRVRAIAKPTEAWRNFLDPETIVGLATGLRVRPKVVLHANSHSLAECLHLPEVAVDDGLDHYQSLLPPGTELLEQPDLAWLLPLHQRAIDNRRRENELEALRARVAELEASPPRRR